MRPKLFRFEDKASARPMGMLFSLCPRHEQLQKVPLPPCLGCTARIIQSGIGRVVAQFLPRNLTPEQLQEHEESSALLEREGVVVRWHWA